MNTDNVSLKVRAILEDELAEFRAFADVPASGIEEMAARLARALSPVIETPVRGDQRTAA